MAVHPNGQPPGGFIVSVNQTAVGGAGAGPSVYPFLGNDGGAGLVVIYY